MDILLALAFAFGLVYVMVRGARWAFKIDKEESRRRERLRLSRNERSRIDAVLEDIAQQLKKKP